MTLSSKGHNFIVVIKQRLASFSHHLFLGQHQPRNSVCVTQKNRRVLIVLGHSPSRKRVENRISLKSLFALEIQIKDNRQIRERAIIICLGFVTENEASVLRGSLQRAHFSNLSKQSVPLCDVKGRVFDLRAA